MPSILKNISTGVGSVDFDLTLDEYVAIGRVTAQWAYLEHGIFAITASISEAAEISIPKDALHASFKRRLNALRLLIDEYCEENEKIQFSTLLGKITNAAQDRHKITHAMWDWDPANPDQINASSFRPNYEFETVYDADRMSSLADRLAEINFALEYPEGWHEAFMHILSEHADENGYVSYVGKSRRLYLAKSFQKSRGSQESDLAMPQEGKLPPLSSEE